MTETANLTMNVDVDGAYQSDSYTLKQTPVTGTKIKVNYIGEDYDGDSVNTSKTFIAGISANFSLSNYAWTGGKYTSPKTISLYSECDDISEIQAGSITEYVTITTIEYYVSKS